MSAGLYGGIITLLLLFLQFPLGKDHLNMRESQIHSFEEIMRRMSSLEEEVKFLKSELSKVDIDQHFNFK